MVCILIYNYLGCKEKEWKRFFLILMLEQTIPLEVKDTHVYFLMKIALKEIEPA